MDIGNLKFDVVLYTAENFLDAIDMAGNTIRIDGLTNEDAGELIRVLAAYPINICVFLRRE